MFRIPIAAAMCVAALAYAAPPAVAAQAAFDRGDVDQYLFHLGAVEACFLGESPGPPL